MVVGRDADSSVRKHFSVLIISMVLHTSSASIGLGSAKC